MALISIILPTRDRPDLLGRAVASVHGQTHREWELIIVDDNRDTPPVGEVPALRPLLADARIRTVRAEGGEPTAGAVRNLGLAAARGDWTTFLDDDDAYRPEKLARQLAAARATGSALVLCGYAVHLPRRVRRRQLDCAEFAGDDLLWRADWGTPFLFHRHDAGCRFDPALAAGEDMHYAQGFMQRHGVRRVPNCAEPLVDVYPQLDRRRVHADGEMIWRAYRATAAVAAGRYGRDARRRFLAKGRLVRAQFGHGSGLHFARCVAACLAVRGWRDWRLALNATLRRLGWFRRWVVA